MKIYLRRAKASISKAIWKADLTKIHPVYAAVLTPIRMSLAIIRDLADGQLSLRAMSLVYTTLLSLVPLLAVSFSVLKGFGVHNKIEPLLLKVLAPLGDQGTEITVRIIGFVENVNMKILGAAGIFLLVITVVSLIQKVERSFNFTWQIDAPRSFARRFSDYLSVIFIAPLLVVTAMGITATVMNNSVVSGLLAIEPFGTALALFSKALPFLIVVGAFTFVYTFIPNTKVRLGPALTGGIVAGLLWETTGWAFAAFVSTAGSSATAAIYSSFAILIFFMIWVYLSWLILLIGASIAFYTQHPENLATAQREFRLSARVKEKMSVLVMLLVGRSFYQDEKPWSVTELSSKTGTRRDAMAWVVNALETSGLLTRTLDDPPGLLPSHDLGHIALKSIIDAVRSTEEINYLHVERVESEPVVDQLMDHIDEAVAESLRGRSLKDLILLDEADDLTKKGVKNEVYKI